MSELQPSVYHNCLYHDEFHSYLDVQFDKDFLHFSVSWPVGEPGKMYGIRSESVTISPGQAIRLAENILEKYKRDKKESEE